MISSGGPVERSPNTYLRTASTKQPAAPPSGEAAAPAEPQDTAEVSAPKKPGKRKFKRAMAKLTGWLVGGYSAMSSVPQGIAGGILKATEASPETEAVAHSVTSTLSHVASGAAIGGLVMGVPGAVVGGMVGFLGGVVSNFVNARAGITEQLVHKVDKAAGKALTDHQDSGKIKKYWHAAKDGAKAALEHGWKSGETSGQAAGAGVIDGIKFVRDEIVEAAKEKQEASADEERKPLTSGEIFRRTFGFMGAVTGAIINLPGAMVYGAMESLASPDESKEEAEHRVQSTRNLMHWATNVGKMAAPIGIGLALGGPLGVGIGVGYGLVTSSVRSIIDGRNGVDRGFARKVDRAINEVNADEDYSVGGHRVFYRASKGVAAAGHAAVTEGWRLGAESGRELGDGLLKNPLKVFQDVFNKVRAPEETAADPEPQRESTSEP